MQSRLGRPNQAIVTLIRVYQKSLSIFLGGRCRFYPSCSSYSIECFQRFSFFEALWYSGKRILKCHPLCSGGFDPCPKIKQVSHE